MTDLSKSLAPQVGLILKELGRVSNRNANEHGFYDSYNAIKMCILDAPYPDEEKERMLREYETQWQLCRLFLMVTEIAEAGEDIRKGNTEHLGEEYADLVIRTVDNAYAAEIDLGAEITRKMTINHERPFMHGKSA
ncbi:MAG: hypothetical protein M0Q49_08545 [Porticoccaceae bacterium]|nr:hypothetical protein [Porticoccaceae bacterium]